MENKTLHLYFLKIKQCIKAHNCDEYENSVFNSVVSLVYHRHTVISANDCGIHDTLFCYSSRLLRYNFWK